MTKVVLLGRLLARVGIVSLWMSECMNPNFTVSSMYTNGVAMCSCTIKHDYKK